MSQNTTSPHLRSSHGVDACSITVLPMHIQTTTVPGKQVVPSVPSNADISYLAEGGANIVYRISIPDPSPPPSITEEYGDGTPPPTEIEDADEKHASIAALSVFDSKDSPNFCTKNYILSI